MIDHMFVVDTRYNSGLCAFKTCQRPQNEHVNQAYLESDRDYAIDPYRGM